MHNRSFWSRRPSLWTGFVLAASIAGHPSAALNARSAYVAESQQASSAPQKLHVSADGHSLEREDGSRFVWIGDTAWGLQKLNASDLATYLDDRAARGFTVIQGPNLRGTPENPLSPDNFIKGVNFAGVPAFTNGNTDSPNESYWSHIDSIVKAANDRGLYMAMVVMWGNEYIPAFGQDAQKAYRFGRWLGARYRANPNVIWIASGEYDLIGSSANLSAAQRALLAAMGQGLRDGGRGDQLITMHATDQNQASAFQSEWWLDFNMVQTGHATRNNPRAYERIAADYGASPAKPTLDGEATYEEAAVGWNIANGVFTDEDVRKSAYWSVFAGGVGFTYGDEYIFQFYRPGDRWWNPSWANMGAPDGSWQDKLSMPGADQMRHLRALLESHKASWVPDQSLITSPGAGSSHRQAIRGADGTFAFVYIPTGEPTTVDLSKLTSDQVTASWFNPKLGTTSDPIGSFASSGTRVFTPPSSGAGNDWVLRLEGTAVSGAAAKSPGR